MTMQETSSTATLELNVSDKARDKATELLKERNLQDGLLRVFVMGGGCSGPQYGMALSNEADEDDTVVSLGALRLVVDSQSLPFVNGAQIDFMEEDLKSGFTISNPNLPSSGGCGGGCSCGAREG
ncbi:MAG: iron-sulfur cluster assembly accessory protein [Dehalococcoidia bacterium]